MQMEPGRKPRASIVHQQLVQITPDETTMNFPGELTDAFVTLYHYIHFLTEYLFHVTQEKHRFL